jgi:NADPH:quinone reductase-like Zn-dependent oxidoreductase
LHDFHDFLFSFSFFFNANVNSMTGEEKERKLSPSLSLDGWNQVLQETGFGGVEMEVHDCEDEEFYAFSVMSSMAIESVAHTRRNSNADVILVLADDDDGATPSPPPSWVDELGYAISCTTGERPAVQQLQELDPKGKICVYLGDLKTPVLRRPSAAQLEAVKRLCTQARGLLWVTRGAAVDSEAVESTLSTGFLRAVRSEYGGNKNLVTLDLDPAVHVASIGSIRPVVQVFERQLVGSDGETGTDDTDYEFAERNGVIHVLRYFKDVEKNRSAFPGQAVPTIEPFCQPNRSLKLCIGTPGLLDTLAFEDDVVACTDLGADELEIEPKAFSVNFRDVMVAMGQLGREKNMCFECAGVIVRAGPNATAQGFKSGDRIMTLLLRGSYATLVRAPWTNATHIPDQLSFETAATLPMVFATAYISLFEIARLVKDESILIHAATGGVGQAAIILAKYMGVQIFATVGSEQKRDFLVKTYAIPPDRIFSSRDLSFVSAVIAETNGLGVDVVLNSLAGPLLQGSFDCLARFGRFVEIGKRDLTLNSSLEMNTFNRSASFAHMDLLQLEEHKGSLIQRTMKEIVRLLQEGHIMPVSPTTVYPLSELETAFRLMQAGKHLGKLVVSMESDDQQLVPVIIRSDDKFYRASLLT